MAHQDILNSFQHFSNFKKFHGLKACGAKMIPHHCWLRKMVSARGSFVHSWNSPKVAQKKRSLAHQTYHELLSISIRYMSVPQSMPSIFLLGSFSVEHFIKRSSCSHGPNLESEAGASSRHSMHLAAACGSCLVSAASKGF